MVDPDFMMGRKPAPPGQSGCQPHLNSGNHLLALQLDPLEIEEAE